MKAGVFNGSSSKLNRLKNSHRSCRTSSTNRNYNIFNNRRSFFGGIFERDRRTRLLANNSKIDKIFAVVDFNHQAVSIEVQILSRFTPIFDKFNRFFQRIDFFSFKISRNSNFRKRFVGKFVGRNLVRIFAN